MLLLGIWLGLIKWFLANLAWMFAGYPQHHVPLSDLVTGNSIVDEFFNQNMSQKWQTDSDGTPKRVHTEVSSYCHWMMSLWILKFQ